MALDPERGVRITPLLRENVDAYLGIIVMAFGYFAARALEDVEG